MGLSFLFSFAFPFSSHSYLQGLLRQPFCLFVFLFLRDGLDHCLLYNVTRNINNLRYADDTTLMAEREKELKNLLMKVKEERAKAGIKLNIQKTKIMASSPITSWKIDGETMETVTGFIFLGSKITADGDCSHEIKSRLLLGRKAMTKLDSILKRRVITLLTNGFSSGHVWM